MVIDLKSIGCHSPGGSNPPLSAKPLLSLANTMFVRLFNRNYSRFKEHVQVRN